MTAQWDDMGHVFSLLAVAGVAASAGGVDLNADLKYHEDTDGPVNVEAVYPERFDAWLGSRYMEFDLHVETDEVDDDPLLISTEYYGSATLDIGVYYCTTEWDESPYVFEPDNIHQLCEGGVEQASLFERVQEQGMHATPLPSGEDVHVRVTVKPSPGFEDLQPPARAELLTYARVGDDGLGISWERDRATGDGSVPPVEVRDMGSAPDGAFNGNGSPFWPVLGWGILIVVVSLGVASIVLDTGRNKT